MARFFCKVRAAAAHAVIGNLWFQVKNTTMFWERLLRTMLSNTETREQALS